MLIAISNLLVSLRRGSITLLLSPALTARAHSSLHPFKWSLRRGFITLSLSLGLMAVALHSAVLRAIQGEGDASVLLCALRALGMLLLGAPYHRLPPQLLPRCVQVRAALPNIADSVEESRAGGVEGWSSWLA